MDLNTSQNVCWVNTATQVTSPPTPHDAWPGSPGLLLIPNGLWMKKELAHCCIAQGTLLNVIRLPGWEGSLGKNGYLECMAEFLSCSLETVTTLLISYTPIQNKLKKKKRKQRVGPSEGRSPLLFGSPGPLKTISCVAPMDIIPQIPAFQWSSCLDPHVAYTKGKQHVE